MDLIEAEWAYILPESGIKTFVSALQDGKHRL